MVFARYFFFFAWSSLYRFPRGAKSPWVVGSQGGAPRGKGRKKKSWGFSIVAPLCTERGTRRVAHKAHALILATFQTSWPYWIFLSPPPSPSAISIYTVFDVYALFSLFTSFLLLGCARVGWFYFIFFSLYPPLVVRHTIHEVDPKGACVTVISAFPFSAAHYTLLPRCLLLPIYRKNRTWNVLCSWFEGTKKKRKKTTARGRPKSKREFFPSTFFQRFGKWLTPKLFLYFSFFPPSLI